MGYLQHCRGNPPATLSVHRLRRGLPGYLILFAPHAFASQRQYRSSGPPSPPVFLPISTHFTAPPGTPPPLPDSSLVVSKDPPELNPGLSPSTYQTAYMRLTPSNSEQRSHPLYYRGCWHRVSRCFLSGYRQIFFPGDRALQPEGLHHPRGVAASGFRPLRKIPHCCLP